MTPQSTFMILAPITPSREGDLRRLLGEMNYEPGRLNSKNAYLPFAQFEQIHFARILILDDQTVDDITVYGMKRVGYPMYLAFVADCDGSAEELLGQMVKGAGDGLRKLFSHCDGFRSDSDLLAWMKARNLSPSANYINWIGRTVGQVREEEALRQCLEKLLQRNSESLRKMLPIEVHETLKGFVADEVRSGNIKLTPASATPFGWQIRNFLHLLGMPLLLLIMSPLLLVVLPFFLIQLRRSERSDPEVAPRVNSDHANLLASIEDHDVTNQFSAMGSLKPGLFRRVTMIFVLAAIDYTARHIFNRGRLARVTSIQFARWVFLDGRRRVIFTSNYDGSLEAYMDDFINKVAFGLNVVFSNGIGYPTTNWLVLNGAKDEQTFKNYLRRHQMPTQVWYNAVPGLTALDKWRNAQIREGLEKARMSTSEIRDWLRLL